MIIYESSSRIIERNILPFRNSIRSLSFENVPWNKQIMKWGPNNLYIQNRFQLWNNWPIFCYCLWQIRYNPSIVSADSNPSISENLAHRFQLLSQKNIYQQFWYKLLDIKSFIEIFWDLEIEVKLFYYLSLEDMRKRERKSWWNRLR